MQSLLKNRFLHYALCVVLGGVVTILFLQEKIVVKKEKVTEYVDKVVEVEKEVIKEVVVYKEKLVHEKVKVVKRKETFPDGRIIEEEIYESEMEQIQRIQAEERNRYHDLLAKKESEHRQKIASLKIHTNPKRLNVFASKDALTKRFGGGLTYALWGPLTVGVMATSDGYVGPTIGIRF